MGIPNSCDFRAPRIDTGIDISSASELARPGVRLAGRSDEIGGYKFLAPKLAPRAPLARAFRPRLAPSGRLRLL